jgi:virginiamycin B lyase
MHWVSGRTRRSKASALITTAALAALALLLVPSGAQAQKKKLKVSVETRSQTQALSQGVLRVSYKSKGLDKLSATAKARPSEGPQVNFAQKATKNNPKKGTLKLRLTGAGEAALAECASLDVRVQAKGKPSKTDNASRMLSEDDPVCAEPVREFETDSSISYPDGIEAGPDGALWFAHSGAGANSLGRLTTDGEYSNFHIPVPPDAVAGDSAGHTLNDVVTGPDGAIWATPFNNDWVRRIDPASGDVTHYQVPGLFGSGATKIAAGPDDALWMTDGGSTLYRVGTDGTASSFPLADPDNPDITVSAYGIAAGGDGAIWFTTPDVANAFPGGSATTSIGRFDPATGETDLFPLDGPSDALGYMTTDRAGRLWFTNLTGNSIGRVDPASGQIVEFQVPTANSKPMGIAFADDGSLWFTENAADNIGRYDPASGQFTEYPLEQVGSLPFDIAAGEDGKVYFTEMGLGRIGQLDPDKAPTGAPNPGNGRSQPPFGEQGRCEVADFFLCQQQTSLEGGTFRIGDALTQVLPSEALTLTAGVNPNTERILAPPAFGPMLEAKPLDVEVGGQAAVTRIGLSGPPALNQLIPIDVTVPIDLYVAPVGSTEGGCVIGPVVQNLAQVPDEEGDMGQALFADTAMFGGNAELGPNNTTGAWTGTLADDAFEVPEARGCGALTEVINTLLSLPSPAGENETVLPFSMFIVGGPALAGG